MDGTHIPTNTPSSRCPLNQRPTDSKNDRKAATKNSSFPRDRLFIDNTLSMPLAGQVQPMSAPRDGWRVLRADRESGCEACP